MTNGVNNIFSGQICKMLKENVGEMVKEDEIKSFGIFSNGLNGDLENSSNNSVLQKMVSETFQSCIFEYENDAPIIDNFSCQEKPLTAALIDGKIEDFQQGDKGDCWLLSTVKAFSRTPKGAEILKNAISEDSCGNVTVTLKGAQDKNGNPVKINMSADELHSSRYNLSFGDDDVLAIERAVDKYRRQQLLEILNDSAISNEDKEKYLNNLDDGANPVFAMQLLTGYDTITEDPFIKTFEDGSIEAVDKKDMRKQIEKAKLSFGDVKSNPTTLCFLSYLNNENPVDSFKLGKHEIFNNHAYTVADVKGDYIYLKNPHDTSKTIKLNFRDLFKHANKVDRQNNLMFSVELEQVKLE